MTKPIIPNPPESHAAEHSTAHLEHIVASFDDDAIISRDLDGVITSWNRGAERLFGYIANEAVGQPLALLVPPDRADEEPAILARIRRGESIQRYETVRRRKDGGLVAISMTDSPMRDASGRVVGAAKVARDITGRKRMEEDLRASEIRYRRLFEAAKDGILILDVGSPGTELEFAL